MDNNNTQQNYAGFWIRWFAQAVNGMIWSLNFFLPLYLLSAFGSKDVTTFLPGLLWFLLYALFVAGFMGFLIQPYLISRFGAGLGKLVCGLEIIKDEGLRLTFKNALFREYIAKIASNALLGLGYYWIFKTPQKQAWHDSLAGTYVVKKHNGLITGLMVFIVFAVINGFLAYQTYNNFKNATTLQFDIITMVTQIQQDFSKEAQPDTMNNINYQYNNNFTPEFDYSKYNNMTMEELLQEAERINTQ